MRYTVIPIDHTNPEGQVAFASVTIRAFCAEMEWNQSKPIILPRPNTNARNFLLDVKLDTTDATPANGTRHMIAALIEGFGWEGLVLEGKNMEGEIVYERVGRFTYRRTGQSVAYEEERRQIFSPEMREITLI
jgi:hypothetical protein